MAIVFSTSGARVAATAALTITANKPTVVSGAGGLLLAFLLTTVNQTHNCSTAGWSKVREDTSASMRASLWIASQNAAAPVFTWASSSNAAVMTAHFVDDQTNPLDTTQITNISLGTGTASPLAVASITSDHANSRFVYASLCAGSTSMGVPTGFTEHLDTAGTGSIAFGSKASGTTAGQASGAISVAAATPANVTSYVIWQFELKPSFGPNPSLQSSRVETAAWVDSGPALDASKMEVSAWVDTDEMSVNKTEVSVWLDYVEFVPSGRRRQITFVN